MNTQTLSQPTSPSVSMCERSGECVCPPLTTWGLVVRKSRCTGGCSDPAQSACQPVCWELVRTHICSTLPDTLDPLQFAIRSQQIYRRHHHPDSSHTTLSHLEKGNTYVRMLLIDYSSAFNTIVPLKLILNLRSLGLNSSLCNWILDFLTGRPQVVRMFSLTSFVLTLSTGAPQGCVLSPLLYAQYRCVATPLFHPGSLLLASIVCYILYIYRYIYLYISYCMFLDVGTALRMALLLSSQLLCSNLAIMNLVLLIL